MGLFAQSEVIVLRPDDKGADLDEMVYQKIFLAGTIDMGKKRGLAEGYLRLVPGASGGTVSLVQSSQG